MADCQFAALALRRASLQARAAALACLAVRGAAGEARHRLAEGQGRVRAPTWRRSRPGASRTLYDPKRRDHLRSGLRQAQPSPRCRARPSESAGPHRRRRSGRARRRRMRSPPPASASCWSTRPTELGGAPILSGYAKLVPSGEWAKDAIGGMVKRVETTSASMFGSTSDGARASSASRAISARRSPTAARSRPARAILCTGFTHFDSVNKPEWGFGTYPDVVTTTQVEQMISSGKGVRCPSDGREPERVAILLCVGSRDRQIGREWCSKICCTVSSNLAMEIREELPSCNVYIYYMDIRTFGLYEDRTTGRARRSIKVKYIKARIAEVTSDGKRLIVKGEDTLVKRPITIPVRHGGARHRHGPERRQHDAVGGVRREAGEARPHRQGVDAYSSIVGEPRAPASSSPAPRPGPETIDDSIAQGQVGGDGGAGAGAHAMRRRPSDGRAQRMRSSAGTAGRCSTCPGRSCGARSRTWSNRAEEHRRRRALRRARWRSRPRCSRRSLGKGRVGELTEPNSATSPPSSRRCAGGSALGSAATALPRCASALVALLDGWSDARHRGRAHRRVRARAFRPTASTAGCATSPPRCCTSPRPSAIR